MQKVRFELLVLFFSFLGLNNLFGQSEFSETSFNRTSILFNSTNLLSTHALDYSMQLKEGGNIQKLVIAPFEFNTNIQNRFIRDIRFNLAQQNGITTLGMGFALFNSKTSYDVLGGFQLVVGANISLFPDWGSPSVDLNKDSLTDNEYSVAQQNFMIGFVKTRDRYFSYHASLVFQKTREQAIEKTPEIEEIGYALGFNKQFGQINIVDKNIQPRIFGGITVEHLIPISNQHAKSQGNAYILAASPNLDVQFNSNIQVRFSIPFQVTEGHVDLRGFGPSFQLFLLL